MSYLNVLQTRKVKEFYRPLRSPPPTFSGHRQTENFGKMQATPLKIVWRIWKIKLYNRTVEISKRLRISNKSLFQGGVAEIKFGSGLKYILGLKSCFWARSISCMYVIYALPSDFTGPYKYNGYPLRRINQNYVIATKTKIDISQVQIPDNLNDEYFRRSKKLNKKSTDADIFSSKKQVSSIIYCQFWLFQICFNGESMP